MEGGKEKDAYTKACGIIEMDSSDLKKLEEDNRKLKELVLNQSLTIMNLKKEMNLD